jgi:hypothetical protein|tara:strand:+ start:1489 stop:2142 length:654 start_codon:yes stop_codon:yes gene_type:complete
MPNPNKAVSTELDAVNQILSAVGQAPVTTLDLQNPEVYTTLQTLRDVSREVQSEGWYFNTEHDVEFTPNSSDEIPVADDILQIDANREAHLDNFAIIVKDGKLYDKYHHKHSDRDEFKFPATILGTGDHLHCDVVYFYQFNNLPYAFQAHVIAKSARKVATKLVGNTDLVRVLSIDEEQTKAALMEYETRQGDYSMFGWNDNGNYYSSYQPFKALAR